MADHEITAELTGEAQMVLHSNKPAGYDWKITDLGPSGDWECSCGAIFRSAEEAADHLEENA